MGPHCLSPSRVYGRWAGTTPGDEAALLAALNVGPVAIALAAGASSFQLYKAGVYDDAACASHSTHTQGLQPWTSAVL